ncbi:MAG: hypothetical protein D6710_11970, partial [Nitrospirae bacterium]
MSLDYSASRDFRRDRELFVQSIDPNKISSFIDEAPEQQPVEDQVFDSIAKTFLKGEALLEGLGAMGSAMFIPVESDSKVITSIQRL